MSRVPWMRASRNRMKSSGLDPARAGPRVRLYFALLCDRRGDVPGVPEPVLDPRVVAPEEARPVPRPPAEPRPKGPLRGTQPRRAIGAAMYQVLPNRSSTHAFLSP